MLEKNYWDIAGALVVGHALKMAKCASPIEEHLLGAMLVNPEHPYFSFLRPGHYHFEVPGKEWQDGALKHADRIGGWGPFRLFSQVSVDKYRLDFALVSGFAKIAIECDGHAFHEKTKEQAAHDKKRDRFLQLDGWRVLRFTGSEIHNDARKCAGDVLSLAIILTREAGVNELPAPLPRLL